MRPEAIAGLVEGAIPFFGGIYATLLGHRIVGKKPGEDLRYDQWHERFGPMFRILGPFMVIFGIFLAIKGIVGAA
jgi:hypothetical protein